jgi:hypothetical protein
MTVTVNPKDVNIEFVSSLIPLVMNSLFNEESFKAVDLREIRDAFRLKQMQSKAWLINGFKEQQLSKNSKILVIGSWLGFTSLCLHKLGYQYITEIDPDIRLEKFARYLNRFNKNFKHISDDVNNIDLTEFDVIINTSCEHILDNTWFEKIKAGSCVFLHSNNLEGYDHTNICKDLNEMVKKYPLDLLYQGELNFLDWKRFMLIGQRT